MDAPRSRAARLSRWFNRTRTGRWLERELVLAGVQYPPLAVFIAVVVAATVTLPYVLATAWRRCSGCSGWPSGWLLLRWWLRRGRDRRRERFVQQIPELARVLANATNAGLSISTAWAVAETELAEPAKTEIKRLNASIRFGASLEEAMLQLNDRLPAREVRVLMSTLVVSARSGGSLIKALRDISLTLDERKEVRREVRTTLAQSRATGCPGDADGVWDPAGPERDPAGHGRADDDVAARSDRPGRDLRHVRHRPPVGAQDDEDRPLMNQFSVVWPALGATGALLTFLLGYRMMRGRPSEYLDAADLVLLKEERRREAAGRLSLLERLAGRLVPPVRRLIGPGGVAYLHG